MNIKTIEYFLPAYFKGLSKEYMMSCILDENIQKNWKPDVGDVIVGETGNIFVISAKEDLHESLGGTMYFYGGGSCNRDGGNVLDSTFCYTANESGKYYHPTKGETTNLYHTSIRNYKFIPYPHEK